MQKHLCQAGEFTVCAHILFLARLWIIRTNRGLRPHPLGAATIGAKHLGQEPDILVVVVQCRDQFLVRAQISSITPFKMADEQVKRIALTYGVSSPAVDGLLRLGIGQFSCTPPKSHFHRSIAPQWMTFTTQVPHRCDEPRFRIDIVSSEYPNWAPQSQHTR